MQPTAGQIEGLLKSCTWPSEALWRAFELRVIASCAIEGPVLELGCGNGAFTELAGLQIDEALDLNPRAVDRALARTNTYRQVRQMDLRELAHGGGSRFETVLANSVLEHVVDVESMLSACCELLRPGGALIATVPLVEMNGQLVARSAGYARFRQRQLEHRNLWSVQAWRRELARAGFGRISVQRYLDPESCRLWDATDLPGNLGHGRYRLAPAVRLLFERLAPKGARERLMQALRGVVERRVSGSPVFCGDGCAALIVATKPDKS